MNNDKWNESEPTPAQMAMADKVENAILQELKLMGPVPMGIIMMALFSTIVRIVSYQLGEDQVVHWFDRSAAMAREIFGDGREPN